MSCYDGDILVENIRRICKEKGISIAQMEKELKWSQGLISRWTKNSPSIGKIIEVINYLNVSYEDLLGKIESSEYKEKDDESLSRKLYNVTNMGKLEWKIYKEDFQNEDIQELLLEEDECRIYYASYEKGFFLLILNREGQGGLEIGAIHSKKGKIVYSLEDTDEWIEELLKIVDQDEYDRWSEMKTKYYIKRFMRTDFN